MKHLRKFFFKKEKSKSEVLYKKISNQEFVDYDDSHNKDNYTIDDIHRIESFFKHHIFGKNTNTCVTIVKTNNIKVPNEIFFIIEKYADEWFVVHTCKLTPFTRKKLIIIPYNILTNNQFDLLENFLCDTIDGVEQIVKK